MDLPLEEPPVSFGPWTPWSERASLRRSDGPWVGLYIWGQFERTPSSTERAYPDLPRQVAYIGETKHLDDRPLRGPHHRTRHYRDTFKTDPELGQLFVSIARVRAFPGGYEAANTADYQCVRVFTRYLEARIYWEYTKKWGYPPALHYKAPRRARSVTP